MKNHVENISACFICECEQGSSLLTDCVFLTCSFMFTNVALNHVHFFFSLTRTHFSTEVSDVNTLHHINVTCLDLSLESPVCSSMSQRRQSSSLSSPTLTNHSLRSDLMCNTWWFLPVCLSSYLCTWITCLSPTWLVWWLSAAAEPPDWRCICRWTGDVGFRSIRKSEILMFFFPAEVIVFSMKGWGCPRIWNHLVYLFIKSLLGSLSWFYLIISSLDLIDEKKIAHFIRGYILFFKGWF